MNDDKYTEWDAAYVLGALSPADRHAYEEHLAVCDECAKAVSSFAAMPGLLAALPADEALALLDDETTIAATAAADTTSAPAATALASPVGANVLPLLAARARKSRRRRFAVVVASAAAAVVLVAGAVLVSPLGAQPKATAQVALRPTVPSALSATVDFTSKRWGTSITMNCKYGGPAEGSGSSDESSWRYALYVTDTSGQTQRVSSWTADPGGDTVTTGSIDTTLPNLTRVEVRNESSGAVLLSRDLGD